MENELKDSGFEPYIPSVHFRNISPQDFLITQDGEDFIKKLEQYETDKRLELEEVQNELFGLQNACYQIYYAAQEGMKCGH